MTVLVRAVTANRSWGSKVRQGFSDHAHSLQHLPFSFFLPLPPAVLQLCIAPTLFLLLPMLAGSMLLLQETTALTTSSHGQPGWLATHSTWLMECGHSAEHCQYYKKVCYSLSLTLPPTLLSGTLCPSPLTDSLPSLNSH